MNLLLDTHVWLWLNLAPEKLPAPFAAAIADSDNRLFVSIVSVWELSIKASLGKISLGEPWLSFTTSALDGVQLLDLNLKHIERMHTLPLIHRDPFDRMLVAQVFTEELTLLTVDKSVLDYGVQSLRQ